ncbi:hypothetical protein ACKWTF_014451 [Chironomus riparius]
MTLNKIKALIWKNWVHTKRNKWTAIIEFVLPIIPILISLIYRHHITIDPQSIQEYSISPSSCKDIEILYTPENEFHTNLMNKVILQFGDIMKLKAAYNEDNMNKKFTQIQNHTVIGVIFENDTLYSPKHLKYTIRMPEDRSNNVIWNTDKLHVTGISNKLRSNLTIQHHSLYNSTCFLMLQNQIDKEFIKIFSNESVINKLETLKSFPIPEASFDEYVDFAVQTPIMLICSLLFSVFVLVKNITIERESRLTESMKIMGLSSALYWSSWFMRSFIILIISLTINLILTVTSIISDIPMFANSNPLIIWLFFISYITSMITFCFLVSVIFKKPSIANSVGSVTFLAAIAPYVIYHEDFYKYSYGLKMLLSMLINTNMGLGIKMIIMAENGYGGVGLGNVFTRPAEFEFSFGELMIWMNTGSALIMLLTIYIKKVFPWDFVVAEPWNFPIKNIYRKFSKIQHSSPIELQPLNLTSDQQDDQVGLNVVIKIKNLSKTIDKKETIENLSLNVYENQITVLLDHNDAGKTTIMSILTGLCQPTSGTASINGYDIKTNIDEARRSMGVVMQHAFYEYMTVKDQLKFFCMLKGMSSNIQEHIVKYSKLLKFNDLLKTEIRKLNLDQKRRLSIATALCGDSNIILMDEPTAGMDLTSRRDIWKSLISETKNRTILIGTQSDAEAQILGDHIAIMSEGQIKDISSSAFLRKKYRLTCVKKDGFDAQAVLDMIQTYAPHIKLSSEDGSEVAYTISNEYLPNLPALLKDLEDKQDILNISSLSCDLMSPEDIYLETVDKIQDPVQDAVLEVEPKNEAQIDNKIMIMQIRAMLLKKFYILRRSWKVLLLLAIWSFGVICLLPNGLKILKSMNKLPISLNTYGRTETIKELEMHSDFNKFYEYFKEYSSLFSGKDRIVEISTNMEPEILNKYTRSPARTNLENLIGASFKNDAITAWFNTQSYHTMPLTINTINRAILKSIAGADYDISVSNYPYSFEKSPNNDLLSSFIVPLLMTLWPLIFIGNCITERNTSFKFLQLVSGTNRFVFWFSNLIFDYILFILICFVLFGNAVLIAYEPGQRFQDFINLMAIGASYGFSWICFIYLFSYLFNNVTNGMAAVIISSIVLYATAVLLLSTNLFQWILMMFAPFTLIKMSAKQYSLNSDFKVTDEDVKISYIMNFVSGCFYLTAVLLIDCNVFDRLYYKFNEIPTTTDEEDQNVSNMLDSDELESNLVLKNVTKKFKKISAGNQLSLHVKQHECFGLLGVNGAGKTTTFKMMTGDELITSGDIWIKGKCLKTQLLEAHKFIGYCPQFDNCIPELTGRETLKIFALIRGIKMDEITEMINQIASELDFKQHLDKQVKAYSGGNKRKLSTALALLGNPELIFLDECTTGVDPQARRQIWNAIKRIRDNHRLSSSIVITSHSMDECEALCTRIGIMVDGQFQCLGPVEDLKNKFSKGSILTIKTGFTDENKVKKLRKKIVQQFLDVELKEQYLDIFIFHLISDDLKYSEVFRKLAEVKEEMHIEDYSLTQMSLEQVFLNICKQKVQLPQEKAMQIANDEARWREQEIVERKAKEAENHKISDKIETIASIRANEILKDKEEQQRIQEEEVKLAKRKLERQAIEDAVKKENEKAKQKKSFNLLKDLFGRNPHKNSKLGDNALEFDFILELGESSKKYETNKDQNIRPIDNKIKTQKDQRNEIYDKAKPLDLIDSDD